MIKEQTHIINAYVIIQTICQLTKDKQKSYTHKKALNKAKNKVFCVYVHFIEHFYNLQ